MSTLDVDTPTPHFMLLLSDCKFVEMISIPKMMLAAVIQGGKGPASALQVAKIAVPIPLKGEIKKKSIWTY